MESDKPKAIELSADEFEKKPINIKRVLIITSIFVIIITTIVLVWGLVFGGFWFRIYRLTAQNAYDKIFVSKNEEEALKSLDDMSFYNENVKNDAVMIINEIYNNLLNYENKDLNVSVSDYKYKSRFGNMAAKVNNRDYIFHYDDFDNLGATVPSITKKFPKYWSRQVLIRIMDRKITFLAFQASGDAVVNNPIDYLNGYTEGLSNDWS